MQLELLRQHENNKGTANRTPTIKRTKQQTSNVNRSKTMNIPEASLVSDRAST